jgi:hypothetical protein
MPAQPVTLAAMKADDRTSNSRCSACGTEFHCGRADAEGCWCSRLPALQGGYDASAGCLCEACLRDRLEAAASGTLDQPR